MKNVTAAMRRITYRNCQEVEVYFTAGSAWRLHSLMNVLRDHGYWLENYLWEVRA